MLGLSPTEFGDMTLAEFDAAQQGYLRRREHDYRTAMNVERWGSFVALSGLTDLKGRDAWEVLPLPWDEKPPATTARVTRKRLRAMEQEALETAKRLEAWQRR